MKKLIINLMALVMALAFASCALAEEENKPSLAGNVRFGMGMEQVEQLADEQLASKEKEIEGPKMRGGIRFYELEYENVPVVGGFRADMKFFFVDNCLVALHFDMADRTDYEAVKAALVQAYGDAVPFSGEKIGSGKYVIDDDADLEDCREMIEAGSVTIVFERDDDGDVEVTFLDPNAAYLTV